MDFSYILEYEGLSIYECSKRSGIPYSTLSDIVRGKTPIDNVSLKNAIALATTLEMSVEDLYAQMHVPERTSFETFKNQVRHEVKLLGDIEYVNSVISADLINKYWHLTWFYETFYLLAMVDYLSKLNNIAVDSRYDEIRQYSLPETLYPMDINLASRLDKSLDIREQAVAEAIPEFLKYNIVERDIRDVY